MVEILRQLQVLEREVDALGRRATLWQLAFWFLLGFTILGWLR